MVTVAVEVAVTKWFTSAIIGKLINKASSYFKDQKAWQSGMKAELDRLSKFRPQIETLVYAAERGDLRGDHNPALEEWLGQLRDAVEEADNVLDELEYRHLKEEAEEGRGKWTNTIVKFAVRAAQQDDVLKRLREVVKTFDNLVAGLGTFAQVLSWLDGHTATEVRGDIGRETGRIFTENEFFGREKEKQTIIHWLNNSETKIISVFSIVGVGGVGKTALAQNLFDHPGLDFQIKMWVCVSTSFEEKAIIMKMLESLTKTKHEFATLDAAQSILKEKITGKKFFLVLDDVWNDEEREKWNKVMAPLKYGFAGSKILLTTRMESVANTVAKVVGETKMSLNLNSLQEWDNLLLFEKYAFAGFNPNEYARLRSIGNKIAKKLRGIPLAVKTIGGMLNYKLEEEYWSRVLEDGALNLDKGTDGIKAAIRLSYEHLPPELKPCFRYCSIFPPDHEFGRHQLVDMWISVGLIPEDEKRQEELASEFFEILVRKSFFERKASCYSLNQVGDSFFTPFASYYSMHDLLHELAEILSKNECLRVVSNDPFQIPQSIRHLSLMTNNILVLKNLSGLKYLRTLLLFCDIEDDGLAGVINTALKGLKSIRYLELSSDNVYDFPKSIGDLVHLRCLSMTTDIPELSPRICMLYHLQILEFRWINYSFAPSEQSIPADICKLSKLKRLYLPTYDLSTIPHVGKLRSLQHLKKYSVKGVVGYDISELEMISLERLPPFGQLPYLKILTLDELGALKVIGLEFYGSSRSGNTFPALETLKLISLIQLEEWREDTQSENCLPCLERLESLTSLKELWIEKCGALKSLGGLEAIPSLKVLVIGTCPMLATISPLDSMDESPRNRLSMALDVLDIDHPELLLAVPLRNLHLTKSVQISGSHSITLLPEQWLLQNGASLQSLVLFGSTLRSVETLPDSLQSLLSLRNLALHNAYRLTRLPELPRSLEILEIYGCSEELAGRLKEGGLDYDKFRHLDLEVSRVLSQSMISW
ncbi:Disease resistance protein RGA2 [Carex littledalei]|uniref:Disease resistance protein RGA2 n=1 Tax=Carex littledalei TaxID=544730 RepID=A0A833VIF7_9POAL|nr:Disease resistance protein RGA2 [Carex littledalei]